MAHAAQRNFFERVKAQFPEYFKGKKVLDCGSLDVNGTLKDLFEECDYTGVDIHPGKNVDVVSLVHELGHKVLSGECDEAYDTIVSAEMLEHDEHHVKSIKRMVEMLKPGGLLVISAAGVGRAPHGIGGEGGEDWSTGNGYYRNVTWEDFYGEGNKYYDHYVEHNHADHDIYFVAVKSIDNENGYSLEHATHPTKSLHVLSESMPKYIRLEENEKVYRIEQGGEVNSILAACLRELNQAKMEELKNALEERVGKPQPPSKEQLTAETVERLKEKLALPVVKMSIGAGLHWKIEPGVDYNTPEEEAAIRANRTPSKVYINHDGCSHEAIDIVSEFGSIPLPDACIDYLELGDVIEHIVKWRQKEILTEWFRLVKKGGKIHISTPNMHRAMVEYAAQSIASGRLQGTTLIQITNNGNSYHTTINPPCPQDNPLQMAKQQIYAWQSNQYEQHYDLYTPASLKTLLEEYGFENIDFSESPGDDFNPGREMAWWIVCSATKK